MKVNLKYRLEEKILLLVGMIIFGVMFISFIYTDILETTRHGMTLWDSLFSGRIREFYVMNENIIISNTFGTSMASIYDFPVYLVFAIWNLPLWIFEKITGSYALDTYMGLLWAKSISLPFLIGIYIYMVKIGEKISPSNFSKYRCFTLMISSVLIMVPILIMGQYDAIGLFFLLIGLDGYISGDEKKFLFWFAVAITFKMFALFVFLPLVLLKNNDILKVLAKIIIGVSLLLFVKLFQKVFFIPSKVAQEYSSGHFITFIFESQMGLVYGGISLFFLAYVLLCLYCFLKKKPQKNELGKWAIYIGFIGLLVFFSTSLTHPQWSILLLPFVYLLVLCETEEKQITGIFIEMIMNLGLLIAEVIYYSWVFNIKTSAYMLAGKLFYDGHTDIGFSIRDWLQNGIQGIDASLYNLVGGAIFIGGAIFLAIWANPLFKRNKFADVEIKYSYAIALRYLIMVIMLVALIVIL